MSFFCHRATVSQQELCLMSLLFGGGQCDTMTFFSPQSSRGRAQTEAHKVLENAVDMVKGPQFEFCSFVPPFEAL